jgi:hypothetical protein
MAQTRSNEGQILGREPELALLDEFLRSAGSPKAVVLRGEPGIGKTSLWEAGVALGRKHGLRVLRARGSGAETGLSFAALIDLLDGVDLQELDGLPAPQRNALEVVLLRAASMDTPPEAHAIAIGLLNALRSLAAGAPLLVAVDDLQWLDGP